MNLNKLLNVWLGSEQHCKIPSSVRLTQKAGDLKAERLSMVKHVTDKIWSRAIDGPIGSRPRGIITASE